MSLKIDLTAEECPMTFVKADVAMRGLPAGGHLEALLRGAEALKNVPSALAESGHKVISIEQVKGDIHRIIIEKK